jgi:hypothetical protein
MESYLDDNNNNHWKKVTDLVDNGGWYADTSDKEFYSANCGKPKDYIITNPGPMIFFRADNMIFDFKNLSVREIESPPHPTLPTRSSLPLPPYQYFIYVQKPVSNFLKANSNSSFLIAIITTEQLFHKFMLLSFIVHSLSLVSQNIQ